MTYTVKEIFYTLQGEGRYAGRAAVFCRFAGCNLWNGREIDRAIANCKFCDTDFIGTDGEGGGKFQTAQALVDKVINTWAATENDHKFVVCTGGEPLLQLDTPLINAFHQAGFEIAIETNGTLAAPQEIDWICVSPKANMTLKITTGDELKLVYPQIENTPSNFEHLDFKYFYLQALDGPELEKNLKLAIDYCLKHPQWRLSLQTHKIIGLP
jgi:7-carboxy-7-deazaguanine synthase (Cx14CxxC type)